MHVPCTSRLTSLDTRKVYTCVFRQEARCACFSSKIHSSANERKGSSRGIVL